MIEPSPDLWRKLLEEVSRGDLPVDGALDRLGVARDHALHLDHGRELRTGVPEVVYGEGKTAEQVESALRGIVARSGRALATRVDAAVGSALADRLPGGTWHARARCLTVVETPARCVGRVAIVSAGTSDQPVAEEARITAETLGSTVDAFVDVGVAGLHRLLGIRDRLREARAVVVVAGMEGALPSVVGGIVAAPVVAVPTSVGYGASFGGIAALLGMLNSCAPGVSVVNIDNGFGAAVIAHRINVAVEADR